MSRILILLLLLTLLLNTSAQPKEDQQYNCLLWRISGNGLTRPSYLFGTMHVTDKRVFYFTDSLYHGLEQCDGFAAELDLASLISQYVNEMMSERKQEERYLIAAMDEKLIAKYKTALEKKFKKPLERITEKELKAQKNYWTQKLLREGEMPTFMDAYLFEIARKQGKWVGGIEDFEDQFPQVEKNDIQEKLDQLLVDKKEIDKNLEWMINTYLKQNLNAIDKSEEIWQGSKDYILLRRNVKMSRRIDSLAHVRSCLFAIGAAHLPGDSGVVRLLRQRGFILTPIYSSQKIAPDKYSYTHANLPWANVSPKDSFYSIQMPMKPDSIDVAEEIPFDMKMHFDMGFMRCYLTTSIPVSEVAKSNSDSTLNSLVTYYKKTAIKFEQRDVWTDSMKGKELIMSNEEGAFRMQVFLPGNHVVLNLLYAFKKSSLFDEDAERFFNSFKVLTVPSTSVAEAKVNWQKYTFDQHAFSIMLPVKWKERKVRENENWYLKQYEAIDNSGAGAYYGILIHEARPGYYSDEDSAYFEKQAQRAQENANAELISSRHFLLNDFPAYEARFRQTRDKEKIDIRIFMINRGNRRYYIFATYHPDSAPEGIEKFFSSLTLLPIPSTLWKNNSAPDNCFNLWSPSEVRSFSKNQYHVYDSIRATTIYITKRAISDFFWANNDSIFFSKMGNKFVGNGDSVISSNNVANGDAKGLDMLIQSPGNHNMKKIRVLLNADTLYTIFGFLPKEEVETSDYVKLFHDFKFSKVSHSRKLYERKPEALLNALATKDSAIFEDAVEAFNDVDFEPADVPLLQKATLIQNKDFDSSYYRNTNAALFDLMKVLDTNHTTISFIRNNYKEIPEQQEYIKPFFLSYLSTVKTAESYGLLKEILATQPPRIDQPYYLKTGLYDSLQLTKTLFPEILSTTANSGLFEIITGVATTLLDSNYIDRSMVVKYKIPILQLAKRELTKTKSDLEQDAYKYYDLIKLLGIINSPESNLLINKFSKLNDRQIRLKCIIALSKNNQPVNRTDLFTLATSDELRINLYEELKKINKENLFPTEYLSQRQLAQSVVYNYADEDDGTVPTVNFIGERITLFMGKKGKFYLFKVGAYDAFYLAVAGPYSLNPKDFFCTDHATAIYWEEEFDKNKVDNFFNKHLKATEEGLKAAKNK